MQNIFSWLFPGKCITCNQIIPQGNICLDCLNEVNTYYGENRELDLQNYVSLCKYSGKVKLLLEKYKYRKNLQALKILQSIILKLSPNYLQVDYIIPVPIHPARFAERGFNQSEEIAKPLCTKYSALLRNDIIFHKANSPKLFMLKPEDRAKITSTAFGLWDDKKTEIHNKSILVFDDIITTGSTMKAIADLIKQYNPRKLSFMSLCRPEIRIKA
jgi:ComF family protein